MGEVLPLATPLTMSYRCLGRYRYTYRFLQLQLFSSLPPIVPSSFTYIYPKSIRVVRSSFSSYNHFTEFPAYWRVLQENWIQGFQCKSLPKNNSRFFFESIKRKEFFFCKQWAENKDSLIIFNILIVLKFFKL